MSRTGTTPKPTASDLGAVVAGVVIAVVLVVPAGIAWTVILGREYGPRLVERGERAWKRLRGAL